MIVFVISLMAFVSKAQVFDVDTLQFNGADDKFINLVIMGDGYQASEFNKLIADANDFTSALFNKAPFTQYQSYFNVFLIKTPSNESGADHAGTATDVPEPQHATGFFDTYFDAQFDSFGFHRSLTVNNVTAMDVLADNVPAYDQAIMLVNTPFYGGSGGEIPVASTEQFGKEIAIHEIGHSFVGLKDEYWAGDIFAGEAINMTQDNDPLTVKWKNWDGDNGVGIFQHCCGGNASQWYKPHQFCIMQTLTYPFCSVCAEGIVETIHTMVDPVESFVPDNGMTIMPGSFPVDFALDLILPNPNTLKTNWTLNGNAYAADVDMVSVAENELDIGTNVLHVNVRDETSLLRVDNHATLHFTTVNWTIEYGTLGIEDITASEHTYELQLYPNPANDLLNILVESEFQEDLNVALYSLDGKQLKTAIGAMKKLLTIDISDLAPGTYVLNIRSAHGNVFSRKIMKKG
ncbi:M64 family metallopeptidase [Sungkyunkwania multivorans]|uniref:M64 family metallopeptidase n=1 Tax=Sungkyunkwania multivorans TaxID=1173618 RepID=A0ABW3CUH1_9FLAO